MKLKMYWIAPALALLALAVPARAQGPQTVRWQEGAPGSQRISRDGVAVKQLDAGSAVVSASIVDDGTWLRVNVYVGNGGQQVMLVRPDAISLDEVRPAAKSLAYLPASTLARSAELDAQVRAASAETRGSLATKTVTKTETSWSDTSPTAIPGVAGDTPHLVTKTTTETVPDDNARWNAKNEAMRIRNEGDWQSAYLTRSALKRVELHPKTIATGAVFFARDGKMDEVVLRIPVDGVIAEIPFTVASKRFLWHRHSRFE